MMQFRSVDEFLALTGKDAPTKAERALIDACRLGTPCELGATRPVAASDATTIRAPLLRLLILGGTPACGLHERGVWVKGAWITGELDLSFCTARGQTLLPACHFVEEPTFLSAHLNLLSLDGSHLPGLFAQGMRVEGSVFLRNLTSTGTVDVNAARLGGQLSCNGATLNGARAIALHAQGVYGEQGVFLSNLVATGTVRLAGAKIGGQLDCTGANLNGEGETALNAQGLDCQQGVLFINLKTLGSVNVNSSRIGGQLDCSGAKLKGAKGGALNAQGVNCALGLALSNVTASGTVDLNGARIGGYLDCTAADFDGAGGIALTAQGMNCGQSVFLRNLTSTGMVDLNAATIGGQLSCTGATLKGIGGRALHAQQMVVSGSLVFRDLASISDAIDLTAAHVGDLVDDMGSWPKGQDDLILDGFTYDRISGGAPVTLSARREWLAVGASVNGELRPQPYTQFARTLRAMGHTGEARKVLYERDCQLFIEAEKADREAYDIARTGSQTKRADMGSIWCRLHGRRFWSWLSRTTIGHGHRPERALGGIAFLTAIATLLSWLAWTEGSFAPNSDVILTSPGWTALAGPGCGAGCAENPAAVWSAPNAPGMDWDSFNPLAYAADLVVPLIDLGQTRAWAPSKDRGPLGWLMWAGRWFFIIAGWVVASLGLAAVTGFVQKNAPE